MKILSCHIENFGKLSDCNIDFSDGINVICKENGWGKSTLAGFICAMFYGMKKTKVQNVRDNERKLYDPWQGGSYGGSLEFETAGKTYVVTRVFKAKEAEDVFELRDKNTNLLSNDFSAKLGEELFKIDKESFARSIFIGQNECETFATDDINAKIGNLTDDTGDMNNFENATNRLDVKINRLHNKKKTGSLKRRSEEITEYKKKIKDSESLTDSMESTKALLDGAIKKREEDRKKLEEQRALQIKITKLQESLAKKENIDRAKNEVKAKEEIFDEAKAMFPGDIPAQKEIEDTIRICEEMGDAITRRDMNLFSTKEEDEYEKLDRRFDGEIISDETLDSYIEKSKYLKGVYETREKQKLTEEETKKLNALRNIYENDNENVLDMIAEWERRNDKKNEATNLSQNIRLMENSKELKPKFPTLLALGVLVMLGGVIGAVAGSALDIKGLIYAGTLFLPIGAVLAFIGFHAMRRDKISLAEATRKLDDLKAHEKEANDMVATAEKNVRDYLTSKNRFYDEYRVVPFLQEIAIERREYKLLKEKEERFAKPEEDKDIESIESDVTQFMEKYALYDCSPDDTEALFNLRSDVTNYAHLKKKKDVYDKEKNNILTLRRETDEFLSGYGFETEELPHATLKKIKEIYTDYKTKEQSLDEAKERLKEIESTVDADALREAGEAEELADIDSVNSEIKILEENVDADKEEIAIYENRMDDWREKMDELEADKEHLDRLNETQEKEKKEFDRVCAASQLLKQAKENLTLKYAKPILTSFKDYYGMISREDASVFHIDADTKITYDEKGMQRNTETMSRGYQDMMGICLRLAYIDVMYKDEKPLIIMDDPFVNLDDEKNVTAKEFLRKISEKYQIIYLTCSETR
ncbi:MAG: AAA family ATPase [Lachnospiraceae bacterium]|nr:AAA family ATPase [Lachnospiraceae bacterium]